MYQNSKRKKQQLIEQIANLIYKDILDNNAYLNEAQIDEAVWDDLGRKTRRAVGGAAIGLASLMPSFGQAQSTKALPAPQATVVDTSYGYDKAASAFKAQSGLGLDQFRNHFGLSKKLIQDSIEVYRGNLARFYGDLKRYNFAVNDSIEVEPPAAVRFELTSAIEQLEDITVNAEDLAVTLDVNSMKGDTIITITTTESDGRISTRPGASVTIDLTASELKQMGFQNAYNYVFQVSMQLSLDNIVGDIKGRYSKSGEKFRSLLDDLLNGTSQEIVEARKQLGEDFANRLVNYISNFNKGNVYSRRYSGSRGYGAEISSYKTYDEIYQELLRLLKDGQRSVENARLNQLGKKPSLALILYLAQSGQIGAVTFDPEDIAVSIIGEYLNEDYIDYSEGTKAKVVRFDEDYDY